jgi:glycosyltransferase involved in cell wall biosynthesis
MSSDATGGEQPDGVVCFAAQDWWYHSRAHSEVQLMLRLAEKHPVLLVNSIGMRMPMPGRSTQPARRIGRALRSFTRGLQHPIEALPNFHVISPVTVPLGDARVRALNASSIRMQVRRAMRRVGISRPVMFVTVPNAWEVVEPMSRTTLVFNRADLHSAFEEVDAALIGGYERELLRHADHVLYVSHALMADERDLTGDRAFFLDHGVDLERFRPHPPGPEPESMAAIPHPRVGYFGGLEPQTVDFTLLERLARDLPDAQLVLVGNATVPMDGLSARPNVHWLGMQPYEDVPSYGAGFDVAIMPWLQNAWIEACNPIKLKEYLALGLPTVSIDFPELARYHSIVTAVTDPDSFSASVANVLATGGPSSPEERRAAVEQDSWDRKSEILADLVGLQAAVSP